MRGAKCLKVVDRAQEQRGQWQHRPKEPQDSKTVPDCPSPRLPQAIELSFYLVFHFVSRSLSYRAHWYEKNTR